MSITQRWHTRITCVGCVSSHLDARTRPRRCSSAAKAKLHGLGFIILGLCGKALLMLWALQRLLTRWACLPRRRRPLWLAGVSSLRNHFSYDVMPRTGWAPLMVCLQGEPEAHDAHPGGAGAAVAAAHPALHAPPRAQVGWLATSLQ